MATDREQHARRATLGQAAANVAAWHDCSVRALGHQSRRNEGWWWYETSAPNIYFTAIALDATSADTSTPGGSHDAVAFVRRHLHAPGGGHVALCDSWDELELGGLGLQRRVRGRWCVRAPAPLPDWCPPDDLIVERVRDARALAAFERVVVEGFGAPFLLPTHGIHAPGILDDPAMSVHLGRCGDAPVAVSMAYRAEGMVGVYGVATVPGARRRGYGTALTRAALAAASDQPAVLQPSPQAWPIYERLGFVEIGTYSLWVPAEDPPA